jgi:PPM family protein phosphatase
VDAHAAQRVIGGAYSAGGSQRSSNEDAFGLPPSGAAQARYGTLVALADGVGSRPGGSAASRAAVHFLQALYYAPIGPPEPGTRLRHCFEIVNSLNRLALPSSDQPDPPLTTLVAAVAYNDRLWVANVGDSRAYCVRGHDGQLQRLTEDHSQVVMAPSSNRPAGPAPATTQPLAPTAALTHAIGLEEQCQVDVYSYTWEPGDRLILASDGLRALPEADLAQLALAGSPTQIARALVAEALRRDDSDNATAIVAAYGPERPTRRAARRPATGAAPARAEPGWGPLGLVALVAAALGLLLGWGSAALAYVYFSGQGLLR